MKNRQRTSRARVLLLVAFVSTGAIACSLFLDTEELQKGSAGSSGSTGTGGVAGTGGGGGTEDAGGIGGVGGGGLSVDEACTQMAGAYCDKVADCGAMLIQVVFGDADTCLQVAFSLCTNLLAPSDTAFGVNEMSSCATTVGEMECDQFLQRETPLGWCARPLGPRLVNAGCGVPGQCATGHCHRNTGSNCGVCTTQQGGGQPCSRQDDCLPGYACNMTDGVCVPYVGPDAACGALANGAVCHASHACTGIPRKCAPRVSVQGAPCDLLSQDCELANRGLWCAGATGCTPVEISSEGQPCNLVGTNVYVCGASGRCSQESFLVEGVCIGPSAVGQACNGDRECMLPAECINSRCQIPDPTLCNP